MKIKDLPLSTERWGNRFRKLLIYIMIIVAILTSLGIFILKDFGLGYKYYEINDYGTIYISSSTDENLVEKTINERIKELEDNDYNVVSYLLNKNFINNFSLISKSSINENLIKQNVIENLDVSVLVTKLTISGDETIYYFKKQSDCDEFIDSLNEYIEQDTESEGVIENYTIITSDEILENKKNEIKEIYEEKEAAKQAERNVTVTSRSGIERDFYNVPLESYVYISSYYGYRWGRMHNGVDFAAYAGTDIYAWKGGTVIFAGWSGGYGNFIIIDHGDGTVSRYGHCSGFAVSTGETVAKGETIGYVGTTGNSTGNHLHFEIKIDDEFVNPLDYL